MKNLNSSRIRGICLDVDGTLYDRRFFWARMLGHLLRAPAADRFSLQELRTLYRVQRDTEKARAWGRRAGLGDLIAQQAGNGRLAAPDVSRLLERWTDRVQPEVLSRLADPALRQLLTRLRLRGYRLGVYSDYSSRSKLEALGLQLDLFDAVVESTMRGVDALKPHPKGFQEVCARLSLPPDCVLYIGDRRETDGAGAQSAGMPFALCKSAYPFSHKAPAAKFLLHWEEQAPSVRQALSSLPKQGCWICGGTAYREYAPNSIPENLDSNLVKVTDAHYGMTTRLLQCENCGFIRGDSDSARRIEMLYEGLVDEDYKTSAHARRYAFVELLQFIRKQRPTAATLLDIGAGTGILCAEARKAGIHAEGVEPSAWAVAEARRNGLSMHEGYFPHPGIGDRKFDIITMCDVIEHVSNPLSLLQTAHRHTAPGGLLVLVTPDVGSAIARFMGLRWWHFRPAHVGYFTPRTMAAALAASGFSVERIRPYVWRFPIGYLFERAASYVALGPLARKLLKIRPLSPLWNFSVPLNLWDSYIYFARLTEEFDA